MVFVVKGGDDKDLPYLTRSSGLGIFDSGLALRLGIVIIIKVSMGQPKHETLHLSFLFVRLAC